MKNNFMYQKNKKSLTNKYIPWAFKKVPFQKSRLQRAVLTFKCIELYFITFPMAQMDYNVQRLLIFLIAK